MKKVYVKKGEKVDVKKGDKKDKKKPADKKPFVRKPYKKPASQMTPEERRQAKPNFKLVEGLKVS